MNHLTCTLTSGLGVLIRDTGVSRAQICQLQLPAAPPGGSSDLCELALAERQNKNKVSRAASLPASLIIFK